MATASNSRAGILFFAIDGQVYDVVGDGQYRTGTVKRETLVGQDRVHGFSESPLVPMIKVKLRDSGGLTVAFLNGLTNSTVVMQLRNGKTVTGRNMWIVDEQTVETSEGSLDLQFEGRTGAVTEN